MTDFTWEEYQQEKMKRTAHKCMVRQLAFIYKPRMKEIAKRLADENGRAVSYGMILLGDLFKEIMAENEEQYAMDICFEFWKYRDEAKRKKSRCVSA